jgi:molybdopterin converting factor small subunit
VKIELKLFMRFKQFLPDGAHKGVAPMTLPEGSTFGDLLQMLGMPLPEDKIVVINGISHKQSAATNAITLNDGDTVAIFPPIAGG